MDKKCLIFICFLFTIITLMAQPSKIPPKQFPTTIARHEAAAITPQVQQIVKPTLSHYITSVEWKGARIWYTPNSATVDSVTLVKFNIDGTILWKKQGWEFVNKTTGTYTISGNNILIHFEYAPYKHTLQGVYNERTGKISGSFIEVRADFTNAPAAYTTGTTTGTFTFSIK